MATAGTTGNMNQAFHASLRRDIRSVRWEGLRHNATVFRLVIDQGVRVTLAGIAAGLILSAMAARLLTSLLYGVSATEPVTCAAAVAVWLIVAPLACWWPARPATRVEPVLALRQD